MPVKRLSQANGFWYDISKKRIAQTDTFPLPGVTVTTPVTTPPTDRPTGPDYVTYESLYVAGDTVTQALNRLTSPKIVTFPEGKFECRDFATGYLAGFTPPPQCKGIVGSGKGTLGGSSGTVFTMVPNSSTKASQVPAEGSQNPTQHNVWKHYPTYPVIYKNFQLAGTEQGHLFSDMQVVQAKDGSIFEDLLINGWYGNQGYPPGETSALAVSGGSEHVMRRIEVDGRRTVGGECFGAMGLTFQTSIGSLFDNVNVHHCRAASIVFYQTINCELNDCVSDAASAGAQALGNGGINLERATGTIMRRPTILGRSGKVHITMSNDYWGMSRNGQSYTVAGGSLTVIDPVNSQAFAGNPRLYVQSWTPYSQGRYTIGPTGAAPTYAFAVSNGYTGTQAAWDRSPSANSMHFPGAAGIDFGSGPNNGPDQSPRVYKADGTPIPYTWILDKHRALLHGPSGNATLAV